MSLVEPRFADEFVEVISFLADNPETARRYRGQAEPGTQEYISSCAVRYANARAPRFPSKPSTVPDPAVSMVLHSYFGLEEAELERVKHEHQLSMAAENLVGDLLERYIASNLEDVGWVWCAGDFVRSIDFVKRDTSGKGWLSLQVKNRDNSENSSSSKVREGTTIMKWHRTVSRTGESRWEKFPTDSGHSMSEVGFLDFIDLYFSKSTPLLE